MLFYLSLVAKECLVEVKLVPFAMPYKIKVNMKVKIFKLNVPRSLIMRMPGRKKVQMKPSETRAMKKQN